MITIITPAYNRASLLPKAYESLRSQTSYNFEWIIVDDGSVDNTAKVAQKMLDEKLFRVIFMHQKNGGKHRALNAGIKKAAGEYVLILDSDDYLDSCAISNIEKWVESIKNDNLFAGVSGLKSYPNGTVVGGKISDETVSIDASNVQRKLYALQGDKAEVYRTDILRMYPFPGIEGEKFIDEAIVWDKIAADGYKLRWYNTVIYYCEYLEGGLTSSGYKKYLNSFQGYTRYIKQRIELYKGIDRLKSIGAYSYVAQKKGLNFKSSSKELGVSTVIIIMAYYLKLIRDFLKSMRSKHGI